MKSNTYTTLYLIITMSLSVFGGALFAGDRPSKLPAGFRYIGHYKLNSKIRVENGDTMPVMISPLVYRVYSDGIDVRVYCRVSGEDSYTSYGIYRSDGIGVTRKSGEIDVVAGVQASCKKGDMLRQLSVTRNSLTMVKMPPRSHRVLVTRAIAFKPAATKQSEPAVVQPTAPVPQPPASSTR